MSNRRKLRAPAGGNRWLPQRKYVKQVMRAKNEHARLRNRLQREAIEASDELVEAIGRAEAVIGQCRCGRSVPKVYRSQNICCVACGRDGAHTTSCDKREAQAA